MRPSALQRVRTLSRHVTGSDWTRPRDECAVLLARLGADGRLFVCVGVPLANLPKEDIYHGSSRVGVSRRVYKSLRSSLHNRDLFPARRFNEGPTPTRPTQRHSLKTRKTSRHLRQYVSPHPSSHPRFRLLHLLSVRNTSHSHPHPSTPPSQPSSPPCEFLQIFNHSRSPDQKISHSLNSVFLTIGQFPPQIRATSGLLVVTS